MLRKYIIIYKKFINEKLGVRFVVVEAYPEAYNFYVEHNAFINLKKDDEIKKLNKIEYWTKILKSLFFHKSLLYYIFFIIL